jgi:hypothetical protein
MVMFCVLLAAKRLLGQTIPLERAAIGAIEHQNTLAHQIFESLSRGSMVMLWGIGGGFGHEYLSCWFGLAGLGLLVWACWFGLAGLGELLEARRVQR